MREDKIDVVGALNTLASMTWFYFLIKLVNNKEFIDYLNNNPIAGNEVIDIILLGLIGVYVIIILFWPTIRIYYEEI